MRVACLVSGGKDSLYSAYIAKKEGYEIVCFLSVWSKNPDSYMFHTPNVRLTALQAEAAGVPILVQETEGKKEEELDDLRRLLQTAKERYGIEGVTTGAVGSVYQASRIQGICLDLGLWCFSPLWQTLPEKHLRRLLADGFDVIVTSVAAYPLDERWLGRRIDEVAVSELLKLQEEYGISPIGEGGEFETFVTDCPLFNQKIRIVKSRKEYADHAGTFVVEEAGL